MINIICFLLGAIFGVYAGTISGINYQKRKQGIKRSGCKNFGTRFCKKICSNSKLQTCNEMYEESLVDFMC